MYVDDVLSGADSAEDAQLTIKELQSALDSAGFPLRKWTSNNKEVLAHIQAGHLLNSDFLDLDTESTAKTLGVRWRATSDEFFFVPPDLPTEISPTKRQVLSQIAKLFDPAGWLAPFVVCAKIFMQEIWLQELGWDDKLPSELCQRWHSFLQSYSVLDQVRIPRWVSFRPEFRLEHHGFCDASQKAYGAAIYVRVEMGHTTMVHLLTAKTRVAPVKTVSLPRLELCGALLLAEMAEAILPSMPMLNSSLHCWTDSTIVALRVLAYVQRFINRCKKQSPLSEIRLEAKELVAAERLMILCTQRRYLTNEYRCLSQKLPVPPSSSILFLNPFLDQEGLIRACGRVTASESLRYDERHPIILPYECSLSRLLVKFTHLITLHGGNQLVVRLTRSRYWVPRVKNLVKAVINACKVCVIYKKRLQSQMMGNLPRERVSFSRPFTYTGMDYAGPFDIKKYTGRACLITKGYVLVFVCFSTKAIHLEPTSDLTTDLRHSLGSYPEEGVLAKCSRTMGRPLLALPHYCPEIFSRPLKSL
ncbi:uncharacterized protein LOC122320347 [Drosophila ficusphila]|uniref:uncharacterized protein LOC122320347 n=1 Tax=Drosophila ficusphila TaxID=30025 RepID=UPI001C8A6731|nr:uncharacterized protein LOC122320347 [Drosophila ficusphila]